MKYFTSIIVFFVFISCATKPVANENEILINSTSLNSFGNEYEMKITKILSDSRCPEGVTCIWAGEVALEVEVHKKQKISATESLSINHKNLEQNKQFFAKYLPKEKKVKSILVLPTKKENQNIALEDYVLKIVLE